MLKILLVGLGPLGRIIARDLHARGLGRIARAVDQSPDLSGRALAEVVPGSDPAVRIEPDVSRADGTGVDAAIVATSSDLAACMPTLRALLGLGLPVVSTCEELLFPWLRHAGAAAELEALCRRTGGRVLGTGVNPGFLMDTLPVVMTAVCRSVRRVECRRIQDAGTRRVPFQRKIGAGADEGEFRRRVREGTLRHVGLGESLHFIAQALGWTIASWHETIDPVAADRDLACELGRIPRGHAAGVRQVAEGVSAGRGVVVRLEFQAAIAQPDPHDRVLIDGEPPIDLVIRGGVHGDVATSAIVLNAVPTLLEAPPGLHTMATIPPVRCRGGSP